MAREDAEPTRPASEETDSPEVELRRTGKRQRAADLFSAHRYRALQTRAFERRRNGQPLEVAEPAWEDDLADPPITADVPAARAARADLSDVAPVDDNGDVVGPDDWEQWSRDVPTALIPVTMKSQSGDEPAGIEPDAQPDDAQGEAPTEMEGDAPSSGTSRNLTVATVVGLVLLGAAVGAAYVHPIAFGILLYGFCVGAVIEWKRALERHGRRIPVVPLVAATLGLGVASWFAKPEGLGVALLVGCAGVVAWRIGDERVENTLADSLAGVLTLLWIPFLASFLFLLELADGGWERVIVVVLAVVGNDTGALIFGMLFGKHKLLERVSPAKTWEGAIGGVVVGTLAASVAAWFFFDGEWYVGAAAGAACAVAAIVGDLAESALKRDIQVKDMSHAIPGHGGILDRIDSLLFAAPVGYVVFAMFLGTLGGGGL